MLRSTVNGATSFTEVFVTGPWCGWCSADGYNVLTDADGDGIYSVEIGDLSLAVEYKYGIDAFLNRPTTCGRHGQRCRLRTCH